MACNSNMLAFVFSLCVITVLNVATTVTATRTGEERHGENASRSYNESEVLHRYKRESNNLKTSVNGGCVLPPYPEHGTYVISKIEATPGQTLDYFQLTVSCRRGFGLVQAKGDVTDLIAQVLCVKGTWSQTMPKCARYCKLEPDPSVQYRCEVSGVGFKPCGLYVAPGTVVDPVCNAPYYYSTESLKYMTCVAGYWDYVAICKPECGRVTADGSPLVLGGRRAARGELPWHAGLYVTTTAPYMQICGGTLVANSVVISAAHCFWSDVQKLLPASQFAVAVGKLYRPWNNKRDVDAQKSDVKQIKVPTLFKGDATNFQEDIAVVILVTPVVYRTNVSPVCLSFNMNFDRWQLQRGNLGKVAGWGLTDHSGRASPVLKMVELPYVDDGTCIDAVPAVFTQYITADKFCAGYTNGTSLCKGDSGGGLSFADKELGVQRYYLRGIVSTAPSGDEGSCNNSTYTAFTRLAKHEDFIKQAVAASMNKTCPGYLFRCADGACVDQGADCNGVVECADGSDEWTTLCTADPAAAVTANRFAPQSVCVLPPYPDHGTYEVSNVANTRPGQQLESFALTVTCDHQGYNAVDSVNGTIRHDVHWVSCYKGEWYQSMPKCKSDSCQLPADPSVHYLCHLPNTTELTPCASHMPLGSTVTPVCNSSYYSTEDLRNMTCTFGAWDYVATCKAECGRTVAWKGNQVLSGDGQSADEFMPWHVTVYEKIDKYYSYHCGGTLVRENVVISIGRLFWEADEEQITFKQFAAAAGQFYKLWDYEKNTEEQKSDVKEIKVSSIFRGEPNYFLEDLALLILSTPFVYKTYVGPACLDFDDAFERQQLTAGSTGKIGAWGQSFANTTLNQKVVEVTTLELGVCAHTVPLEWAKYVTGDKMCVSTDEGDVEYLRANYGSGLVFARRGRHYLRGALHSGCYAQKLCNGNNYALFTRIIKLKDFILYTLYQYHNE